MQQVTCSVDGCERARHPHAGQGLCGMHYTRLVRHGDVGPAGPIARSASQRFASRYEPSDDGCWNWTGYLNASGYGMIATQGRNRLAHRVSYEIHVGSIPEGHEIDHLCRNIRCVNPAHLEAVTGAENLARQMAVRLAKTTCKRGHELTEDNLAPRPSRPTWRYCRKCAEINAARRKAKKLAAKEAGQPAHR